MLTPKCQVMLPLVVSTLTSPEAWDCLGFTSAESLAKLVRLSPTQAGPKDSQLQKHLETSLLPTARFEDADETLKWLMSLISVYSSLTERFTAKGAYTRIAAAAHNSKVTHQHTLPSVQSPAERHLTALRYLILYLKLAAMLTSVRYEVTATTVAEDILWGIIARALYAQSKAALDHSAELNHSGEAGSPDMPVEEQLLQQTWELLIELLITVTRQLVMSKKPAVASWSTLCLKALAEFLLEQRCWVTQELCANMIKQGSSQVCLPCHHTSAGRLTHASCHLSYGT